MAGRDEKRLAILLNSCKSGNILDSATSEITDFIQDYFLSDKVDEEDHGSDSDDEELEELQPAQDFSECQTANADDDEDEILEEHVVQIDRVAEHCVEDMDCNGVSAEMQRQAEQWSCNCEQIKAQAWTDGDQRRGCINQFSPEECVEVRLSLAEMDRGMQPYGFASYCYVLTTNAVTV